MDKYAQETCHEVQEICLGIQVLIIHSFFIYQIQILHIGIQCIKHNIYIY